MKCKLCKDLPAVHPEDWPPDGIVPKGTILDQPKAYKYVRHGVADPADEECRVAAGMSNPEIVLAKMRQRRTAAGIHPDDFEAYDKGIMVGYNPDGSFKPGPNFAEAEWEQRKAESPLIIEEDYDTGEEDYDRGEE